MANYAMVMEEGANYHSIVGPTAIAAGTHTFDIAIDLAIGRDNVKEAQLVVTVTPQDSGITNATAVGYDELTGKASVAFTGTGSAIVEVEMVQSIQW